MLSNFKHLMLFTVEGPMTRASTLCRALTPLAHKKTQAVNALEAASADTI